MKLLNYEEVKNLIIAERDIIPPDFPPAPNKVAGEPNRHGMSVRCGLRIALRCLEKASAVHSVPVVLCKDCEYSMLWLKPQEKAIGECALRKWNGADAQFCYVGENDFCSNGRLRK